ncbi:ArsR family transcriptional regulator, arsenate/arsenite/antimonite-responsive transcriptional repressor [Azospirillaceae bacterium]
MLAQFEQVAKAVADPSRIRILKLLELGELCVCQVTMVLGLAPATVSKHLSLLRMAGLATQRKSGRWVYYGLASRSNNLHAEAMATMIRNALDDDETIVEDRCRLERVKAVPIETLCAKDVDFTSSGISANVESSG